MIDYGDINQDLAKRAPDWAAVRRLRSQGDYFEALEAIDLLSGATEDSPEDDLLEVLSALVAAYEAERG